MNRYTEKIATYKQASLKKTGKFLCACVPRTKSIKTPNNLTKTQFILL